MLQLLGSIPSLLKHNTFFLAGVFGNANENIVLYLNVSNETGKLWLRLSTLSITEVS